MEKPHKHEVAPKSRRSGDGTASEHRHPHTSSSRSKVKNPQAGSAERRYKEMLHTTSHIYQTQTTSGMTDTPEESRLPDQIPQLLTKETLPVREKRSFSTGSIVPEGMTTDVPLTQIMSREKSTSTVIKPEVSENRDIGKKGKSSNDSEKNAEHSVQQKSMGNSVANHEDQNDCLTGESTCRKHSNANADGKQKALISRPKLCESCTVSMLSYIAMLRDMLDEVTSEITKPEDQSVQCAECVKERVIQRNQLRTTSTRTSTDAETVSSRKSVPQRPHDLSFEKQTNDYLLSEHKPPAGGTAGSTGAHQQSYQQKDTVVHLQQQQIRDLPVEELDSTHKDPRTVSTGYKDTQDFPLSAQRVPKNQTDFPTSAEHVPITHTTFAQSQTGFSDLQMNNEERTQFDGAETCTPVGQTDSTTLLDRFGGESSQRQKSGAQFDTSRLSRKQPVGGESRVMDHSETPSYITNQNGAFFGDTYKDTEESPTDVTDQRFSWKQDRVADHEHKVPGASIPEDFHPQTSPFLRDSGGSDGILSALSNEEREVYDSARGGAGWETMADTQDYRDTSFGPNSTEEAFVTMATTNAEAMSCLVLGSSLLLCRTTRTLCVLVTDGVSPSLRAPLASVFQVVQSVRSLDTVGTTKVALLDQPDLGIFFRKLHVWRLVQFSKCVFLNPDTLVIQNSDELFCHEELSAVPDIGWPDCFNSGVYVFQPSVETFWKLVGFAESEGSYDGGDQGLLNAFFKNWSKDIHKKLSFIYNLMANVSYTYTPAFKQFGRNVKIVQFQGAFKPWHVKFYTGTGQIAPSTAVHPTYVQFVHVWLNIFRVRVLPLFSQDIQSFASSQNIISASELLKFYPSPVEADPDFLLTPPSVRIRPDPLGTPKQPSIMRRHSIGSPKELEQETSEYEGPKEHITQKEPPASRDKGDESLKPDDDDEASKYKDDNLEIEESRPTVEEVGPSHPTADEQLTSVSLELETTPKDDPVETAIDSDRRSSLPGSEIGDYHGMAAWEQGRMDYMGSACSENIIKRLHFLMDKPNDHEKPE